MEKRLTKADAARILRLTPAAVVLLEKKGLLRAERTEGGIRLFLRADVEQLAQDRLDLDRRDRSDDEVRS